MNNQQIDFTDMYDLWSSESSFWEEYWWLILVSLIVGLLVFVMICIKRSPQAEPEHEKDVVKKLYALGLVASYAERCRIFMECSKRVLAQKYGVETRALTEQEFLALCVRLDIDPLLIQDFKQLVDEAQLIKFAHTTENCEHDFLLIKRFIQGWVDEPEN